VGTRAAVLYSRADGGGAKRVETWEACQGGTEWRGVAGGDKASLQWSICPVDPLVFQT